MNKILDILFTSKLKGNRTKLALVAWAAVQLLAYKGVVTPGQVDAANIFLLPYGINAAVDHGK